MRPSSSAAIAGGRWLYHALPRSSWLASDAFGEVAPESLAREGFVHCSYRDVVVASARLYFAIEVDLVVLRIDPRVLGARGIRIEEAVTPRGPMPHVHGAIPRDAVVKVLELGEVGHEPDAVAG